MIYKETHLFACFSFLFGAMGVFSFAPFHLYPLILFSLAGFLWLILHSTPKQAFRRGFYYGLGFFGASVYWVYISLHMFGGAPVIACVLLTTLLIGVMALFPACVGGVLNKYFPENTSVKMWLLFPAVWTLTEWVRTWLFTGFPWMLAGYSQTIWPLNNLASIGSVHLISFVLAHIAGGMVYFIYAPKLQRRNTIIYLVFIFICSGSLSFHHWTHQSSTTISVSLVQGNITPSLKWQPDRAETIYQHYLKLTQNHWQNHLVIWPEAALPVNPLNGGHALNELIELTNQQHAGLIFGTPYSTPNALDGEYNAAIGLGNASGTYLKKHLVPFGEYYPLERVSRILLNWLNIPMSHFKSGETSQSPMRYNNTNISTLICYEIIFPTEARYSTENADFILMMSDDAWFGHSLAQAQHLQMAQMRAIEMGRYVVSVTNNGITAIINQQGKIISSLASYQDGVLEGKVLIYTGKTAWATWGSNIYLLICILSLIMGKMTRSRFAKLV